MIRKHLARPLSNERGMALFIAMTSIILILYLTVEITYETSVDYIVNAQVVNKLKAHYNARAGLELALLRIKIYQQAQASVGKQLGSQAAMLDEIWKFPLAWPPVLPEESHSIDKDSVNKIVEESGMQGGWRTDIQEEGSRIDLNDLVSKSEHLRENTKSQLLNIFKSKMESDENWARDNRELRYEEIVNNIIDWVDPDTQAVEGGDESAKYTEEGLPPHRAFRTLEEIRLVAGMTDQVYDLLAPYVTIYGAKGINPNYATKDVLMSIDVQIKPEIADKIIERRDDATLGFFEKPQDFWDFVAKEGVQLDSNFIKNFPLFTESIHNFRVISTGYFGSGKSLVSSEITAVTYDFTQISNRLAKMVKDEEKAKNPPQNPAGGQPPTGGNQSNNNSANSQSNVAKGRPRIVYYNEK